MEKLNEDVNAAVTAMALVHEAERVCETDPAMCEVAAMVYVGDVYALREPMPAINDGWGGRCYNCGPDRDPL